MPSSYRAGRWSFEPGPDAATDLCTAHRRRSDERQRDRENWRCSGSRHGSSHPCRGRVSSQTVADGDAELGGDDGGELGDVVGDEAWPRDRAFELLAHALANCYWIFYPCSRAGAGVHRRDCRPGMRRQGAWPTRCRSETRCCFRRHWRNCRTAALALHEGRSRRRWVGGWPGLAGEDRSRPPSSQLVGVVSP